MNALELLPIVAVLAAAGASVVSALECRVARSDGAPSQQQQQRQHLLETLARWLLIITAVAAGAAFLALLFLFVIADVSYEYVFLYTKTSLPLKWRIAGTWAGREGSLLLWSAALAAVAALVARAHARAPAGDAQEESGRRWTRLFLALFTAAFLAAVVAQKTFSATPEFFLQGRPDGNGLNPTLKSPFILIHPPLMFAAYALSTVPAAAVLGHLASGTDRWGRIGLMWARVDWMVYTFAMGLGGIWAYYTLGFGGYWAWDPVEVANLLPWLALTVYLHTQLHHARHGSYKVVGPFLGLLPFLLTLFSTLSTRSGLWVSVHAFTDPTNTFNPDAPARFLDILEVEPSLLVYVRLFLATFAIGLALWCVRLSKEQRALPRIAPIIAAAFAAFACLAALAPESALSLLFEAASVGTGGHTGYGLLALAFLAVVAAASPALSARGEESEDAAHPARHDAARGLGRDATTAYGLRINLRSLNSYAVTILGLGLLVIFLFHMAAVNGWDQAFYEARIPFIAAPAALGLLVLQTHAVHGRRRSMQVAAGALVVAIIAALIGREHRGGWFLLGLCIPLVVVSLDKVRRAALPPGVRKPQWWAPTLLWLGALLNVLFWLNPSWRLLHIPGIGWQAPFAADWHPVWPVQLLVGAIALYALWGAHRILAGAAPPRPLHVHAITILLGGFYVASLLGAVALVLHLRARRMDGGEFALAAAPLDAKAKARLRQAALYGLHLAVAVALLGYGLSTYWKETATAELQDQESLTVGGHELTFNAFRIATVGEPFAQTIRPVFEVERRGGDGRMSGVLDYEEDVGAYFPLPATMRAWNGDLYVNIHAVRIDESACSGNRTIEAYQAAQPPQACDGDLVGAATVEATWLPGLGVVWLALALFVGYMAVVVATEPARRVEAGPIPEASP